MSKAANAYLATQVTTTSQGQLLIMLYDAGIKFLRQAREYMIAKDYAKKGILISRAMDIITELASSLNKERGGQIAENLQSLYTFCNIELAKANMKMDTKKIDDVVNILSNIRDAYSQILPQVEGETSQTASMAKAQAGMAAAATRAAVSAQAPSPATAATPPKPATAAQDATASANTKPAANAMPPVTPGQPPVSPLQPAAKPKPVKKPPLSMVSRRAANAYGNNS